MTESARDIIATWAAPRGDRMQGIPYHDRADAILAALTAAGFAIVPVEPTIAMLTSKEAADAWPSSPSRFWRAMLTASKENT